MISSQNNVQKYRTKGHEQVFFIEKRMCISVFCHHALGTTCFTNDSVCLFFLGYFFFLSFFFSTKSYNIKYINTEGNSFGIHNLCFGFFSSFLCCASTLCFLSDHFFFFLYKWTKVNFEKFDGLLLAISYA